MDVSRADCDRAYVQRAVWRPPSTRTGFRWSGTS